MAQPISTGITADAFYQSEAYQQHDLIELIDGEVIIHMPPNIIHQRIVREILLFLSLLAQKIGGEALSSPLQVRLNENTSFEPDVLYITPANADILQQDENRIIGAPDLVVEVLSPSTAKFDRQQKFLAYERNGVSEYWIVDPAHETIEVWTRTENNATFDKFGVFDPTDTMQSPVLDNPVPVAPLFSIQPDAQDTQAEESDSK